MKSNCFNCLKLHLPVSPNRPNNLRFNLHHLTVSSSSSFCSYSIVIAPKNPVDNPTQKEQALLSLFKRCSTVKHVNQIHTNIIKSGLHQNLYLAGKIIFFCAASQQGSMDYGVSVFESIKYPDGFIWNTMIRGFGRTGEFCKVFDYYKRMQMVGEFADNFTLCFLLKVCGQLGSVMLGKQLHSCAVKCGLEGHVFVRNALIHMYGMLRNTGTAHQLFEEIPEPELVAWNTIIDCHVHSGCYRHALELFLGMIRAGEEPDEVTLVVILAACAALGALEFGRCVHSLISRTFLVDTISLYNALIDMYAKCGAVDEAFCIFGQMVEKNIVSWNTTILGFAVHGNADKALKLFSQMVDENLETPNDVTFLGVLCACSHGGMVDEGRRYFESMIKDYHIQPTIKHYGCMVDILGRAGLVEAGYQLIREMPMQCNAIVWRTLLGACRLHGKVELGEQVRMHLLDLEPDHSSDYALLANMYASMDQWDDVTKVRNSMNKRRIQKPEPGNSLIGFQP